MEAKLEVFMFRLQEKTSVKMHNDYWCLCEEYPEVWTVMEEMKKRMKRKGKVMGDIGTLTTLRIRSHLRSDYSNKSTRTHIDSMHGSSHPSILISRRLKGSHWYAQETN